MKLPKLGDFQPHIDYLKDGFACDFFVLERMFDSIYQEICLLHIYHPPTDAAPQMEKIFNELKGIGFKELVRNEGKFTVPSKNIDIVLIGYHHGNDMEYVNELLSTFERNYGVLRPDILIYPLDEEEPRITEFNRLEVMYCPHYEFTKHALHMIISHLWNRRNFIYERGFYVLLDRLLNESLLLALGIGKKEDTITLGQKIGKLRGVLKGHLPNSDAEFVLKFLNFLVEVRNYGIHGNEEAWKKRKESYDKVRPDLVQRGWIIPSNSKLASMDEKTTKEQNGHSLLKILTVSTYIIKDWVNEYAKLSGQT